MERWWWSESSEAAAAGGGWVVVKGEGMGSRDEKENHFAMTALWVSSPSLS